MLFAQRAAGVRFAALHDFKQRAATDHAAAAFAAFRAQIDDPICATDDIQVVLDDQQRMAGLDQSCESAQQLGDIVEMQARGRLIE